MHDDDEAERHGGYGGLGIPVSDRAELQGCLVMVLFAVGIALTWCGIRYAERWWSAQPPAVEARP